MLVSLQLFSKISWGMSFSRQCPGGLLPGKWSNSPPLGYPNITLHYFICNALSNNKEHDNKQAMIEKNMLFFIQLRSKENNSWIYKNDFIQKFTSPWFLILFLPEWSPAVFFCLVIVVHVSLVCPEQLNCLLFFRKIFQVPQILWFSSIFVYFNPFQQWLYDFEIHLFTLKTTEGHICNYYRRFKCSLMLEKEKRCIKSRGVKTFEQNVYIFLFLPKYHIFSFSTAIQRLQKIVTCFPEDK